MAVSTLLVFDKVEMHLIISERLYMSFLLVRNKRIENNPSNLIYSSRIFKMMIKNRLNLNYSAIFQYE